MALDLISVRHIPGIVKVVRIEDFLGVVAEREENAVRAAQDLKVEWKPWSAMPDFSKLELDCFWWGKKIVSVEGEGIKMGWRLRFFRSSS